MSRRNGPPLTAETAAQIKALWQNTSLNQAQIAARLGGINQGRVSEVVNGRKFSEIAPSSGGANA